jgi:hypothetical protein
MLAEASDGRLFLVLASAFAVADLVGDVILFGHGSTSHSLGLTGVCQPWYIWVSLVEIAATLA